jgi:hypothetical protein
MRSRGNGFDHCNAEAENQLAFRRTTRRSEYNAFTQTFSLSSLHN